MNSLRILLKVSIAENGRCTATLFNALPGSSTLRPQSTLALESPVSTEALDKARAFEEIPGPKPFPLLGNIHKYLPLIGEYSIDHWHETQKLKFQQFGKIVQEKLLPGYTMVHLFDSKDIETVSRHEGRFPKRVFFTAMRKIRVEKPEIYSTSGVAAGNGEEWYHLRSRSQKVLMRPQVMKAYLPQMNVIADDLINKMRNLRDENCIVPGLMNELFKWAIESVAYIFFVQRMGCLADNLPPDSMGQKYINAVNTFFLSSVKVELATLPIWRVAPFLSPSFRKLKKAHDFFFESAMNYVKENISRIENSPEEERECVSVMEQLLRHCDPRDASVMAIDSMAAGIDTTALTVAYVLRNLAANPDAQRRLQEEVDRIVPNGSPLTAQAMEQMPYLRACVKESMRISPTVQGTSRTLDNDIVLSGYRVPANTLMTLNYYVSGVQESNFPDALKYKPERWLKRSSGSNIPIESFAFQPFGFGPRMCIGRRIAELEMFTLLTKIMQNFWVKNKQPELDIRFQLVLMIKSPLMYEFLDRKKST